MKILTFDGGGIRGIVSLVLLKRIQQRFPNILDETDLFSGTSTGGIIALCLAYGHKVDDILDLYVDRGQEIFDKTWEHKTLDLLGLAGAKFDNDKLKSNLFALLGDSTLGDLKKKVVIPSFQLDRAFTGSFVKPVPGVSQWAPYFFCNFPGCQLDVKLTDIASATSAAPTYFPSHNNFIDGGVCANNPAAVAMAFAIHNGAALENIKLLSIGTGTNLNYISGKDHDWGLAQWAPHLVNLLFDASTDVTDFICETTLQERHFRIAPIFPPTENIPLDGWDKSKQLIDFANGVDLDETFDWFNTVWKHV